MSNMYIGNDNDSCKFNFVFTGRYLVNLVFEISAHHMLHVSVDY